MPSAAYRDLARFLVGQRRQDLLLPLASARAGMARAARLVEVARAHADAAGATRLRAEVLRQRAIAERAVFRIIECIGEEPDGAGLVDDLMGTDGRTLAEILLDGE
jgi:hypothetical protein